ncbi:3-deoxy-manno-octulosonate-8-phosphatase KdsC [Candidatus Pantoea edessiphila]|uniref:3-deoxy-D-manno-octulosonate 8-phosphate phosphatase KdsC n=1 Tax=Candidatus Pantoea edessiphila TaxID=2044610 RepID=A0A2P5SZZ5_9GAMM|nr:3-deoxy-manno-octulosonate-8-phosphatase KdsC [Candidatus Pantoea edessiphila]PPI87919.1 3-deoxy-manno-octulosonate-8-phosphatase KdsC [Candidatus Pantoea edessiphila]
MKLNYTNIETCYGPIDINTMNRASKVKLLICDVDGVMSDGKIYLGNKGEELKAFNVRDGYGICCLLTAGLEVAVITGRNCKLVKERCKTLGISHVYHGQSDKMIAYRDLLDKLSLLSYQVSYIGDDVIDLPVMIDVGLSVAVPDAHPLLLSYAHYITKNTGGLGAVRELCDLILISQKKFAL